MHQQTFYHGHILLLTLVFLGVFSTIATAYFSFITSYARSENVVIANAQAFALAEAGIDAAAYQLNQNPSYTGETNTALGNGVFTISVASIDGSSRRITSTGYVPNSTNPIATKTIKATVGINNSVVSFHYGVQAGNGGFSLNNSSRIIGNVFSGGPVIGDGGNYVYGDVISSGVDGLVYGIHATSSVYAHTIGMAGQNTIVDKNAYYVSRINTIVNGTSYPDSLDQPMVPLPISDDQISQWETYAEEGGEINSCDSNGNYIINSSVSLGPKKIACNLIIKSPSAILTVTGPIWITGNLSTQTGPTIKIASELGSQNVAIIADDPSNQTGSGLIDIGQSTIFQGSGSPGSFVFLISQNRSAESGGSVVAVNMGQGASALVAYASHGLVVLGQSVSVKEVTGYKISLSQTSNVIYDTGLPSIIFKSGPGASWNFVPGSYTITQ